MSRILLIQPTLQPPGGDRLVAAWMIEALRSTHELTVVTQKPPDLDEINRFYGTSLKPTDFEVRFASPWINRLLEFLPVPLVLVKNASFNRACRLLLDGYDVPLTANNECDFGRRTIQYVHFPWRLRPRPEIDHRWYHRSAIVLSAYYLAADALAGFSEERTKLNLTLVNSDWTGVKYTQTYDAPSVMLYPPVPIERNERPSCERSNGFVCVGRLAPEKEIERIIRILQRVRERGYDLHLHVVGTVDHPGYSTSVLREISRHSTWVSFDENLSRRDLGDLMGRHRYGIHGMREEHFGIAVAELTRAGCIVFVPNGGGQAEIVGGHDLLTYDSDDDAVENISRVMRDDALQAELQHRLLEGSDRFSTGTFCTRLREIVRRFEAAGAEPPST